MNLYDKTKRITALLLAMLTVLLSSCGSTPPPETAYTHETEAETEEKKMPIDPDSVVYPDEELPSVYITTEGGVQATSKEEYIDCTFRLGLNDRYSAFTGDHTDADGAEGQLRCRGNASYNNREMRAKNKYSYKLKLDKKADVLGMGKSKHWLLINNWRDTSNLRHKFAYDFAEMLGVAHTNSTWVELYYNGEYRGLYLLAESIRISEDRVDTFDWEEFAEDVAGEYAADKGLSEVDTELLEDRLAEDLSWISKGKIVFSPTWGSASNIDLTPYYNKDKLDFSSGYLIEWCTSYDSTGTKWKTALTIPLQLDSPKMLHTNTEMYEYVRTLVQDFEDAVRSPNFYNSKGKHYSEYVDMKSLVDYWMIWNFTENNEFGARSMYFYIDGGKIHFGPIWDFDCTLGNVITMTEGNSKPNYWVHDKKNSWFKELFGDPWFTSVCAERWYDIREGIEDMISGVELNIGYMGEAAERCYERNGVRYETIRNPAGNNGQSMSPKEDFALIRGWLRERVKWLDEHFSETAPRIDASSYVRDSGTKVSLSLNGTAPESDKVTLHGIRADHVIRPDAEGTLKLKLSTTHTTTVSADLYLNCGEFLGEAPLTVIKDAEFEISTSLLDMREGALNVIFIPMFRKDGSMRSMTSVLIRVSSQKAPTEGQVLVSLRGSTQLLEAGGKLVFPEPEAEREGFVAEGWSCDGVTVYRPGESIAASESAYYFVKWKRLDRFNVMKLD